MNELAVKYSAKGLVILGFPCNQFGHQENGSGNEILNTLKYVRPGNGFEPKIEMFNKVSVNGSETHPRPQDGDETLMKAGRPILWSPVLRSDVAWNFENFLIDSNGVPFKRYNRYFLTADIASDIEQLLP